MRFPFLFSGTYFSIHVILKTSITKKNAFLDINGFSLGLMKSVILDKSLKHLCLICI